jgi:hypothetical protein
MSTPVTSAQRIHAFTKWGVPIFEHSGWENHNRAGHGEWGPVNGIMIHHTGDDAPDDADVQVLWNGRADLPGPLCDWGMRDDGTAVMIGNGRTNHAGSGSGIVLAAVVAESYSDYPPRPGKDDTDGNTHFYGQETMYSGGHVPDLRAYNSTIRVCAALCEFHGWTGKSVIGHKEWTSRKPDPGHIDMHQLRLDVNAALAMGCDKAKAFNFGPVK